VPSAPPIHTLTASAGLRRVRAHVDSVCWPPEACLELQTVAKLHFTWKPCGEYRPRLGRTDKANGHATHLRLSFLALGFLAVGEHERRAEMYLRIIRLLALVALINLPASVVSSQTVKPVTVGFLSVAAASIYPPFVEMLRERGYEEGRNLRIEFRSAKGRQEALPKLAAELVSLKPDVLVGGTTPAAMALKHETDSIPIVFFFVSDPVATGLVKSFDHPGGNVTGANVSDEYFSVKTFRIGQGNIAGNLLSDYFEKSK
jgi:hypothetical protein